MWGSREALRRVIEVQRSIRRVIKAMARETDSSMTVPQSSGPEPQRISTEGVL